MPEVTEGAAPVSPGAYNLARASWIAPLVAIGITTIPTRLFGSIVVKEGSAFVIVLAGFVAGAVALGGIRRFGRKHILAPALTGIGINGFLILAWTSNFLAAYARARAARGQP